MSTYTIREKEREMRLGEKKSFLFLSTFAFEQAIVVVGFFLFSAIRIYLERRGVVFFFLFFSFFLYKL